MQRVKHESRYIVIFWGVMIKMLRKRYGIKWSNAFWVVSLLLTVAGIYGVLQAHGGWHIAAIIILSIFGSIEILYFLFILPSQVYNRDISVLNTELIPYKKLKSQQEGREWEWLHPVIEWLDFNRKGLADDRIMVSYEIDSGLIDDFKPYRMWLKLNIGQYEPEDGYEIVPPHNLLAGRRSQGACIEVPITDKRLLERVDLCRKGKEISQTLRIVIQARPEDEKRYLEPEYSVNPYSDFIPEDEDTKL